jgi:hypothetical protein
MTDQSITAARLRDEFYEARRIAALQARWDFNDPKAPSDACRYCGRYWQRRAGSQLDGHAACIVTPDFKRSIGEILRSPSMTYALVAKMIGATSGMVTSWAFSAGVAGPLSHPLRRGMTARAGREE